MTRLIRPTLTLLAILTLITGVIYPLAVMGLAQLLFPGPANGSEIIRDGKPLGSSLIGQPFTDPKYFWGRPSATAPFAYATVPSGASNQGPTNPALVDAVRHRVEALRAADPGNTEPVPVDLVTASGSGLDPHISPAAAQYQLARVARARGMSEEQVRALVEQATAARQFGILGEPRVNVLQLNLLLDRRW
jgi:K+-transporting ATPase ATPase C chain